MPPKSTLLDPTLPDVARLVTATVQARDAVDRRSWSHPQELTGEEWWADVLADPRARRRGRRQQANPVEVASWRLARCLCTFNDNHIGGDRHSYNGPVIRPGWFLRHGSN